MRRSLSIAGALALTAGVLQAQGARARVYTSSDDPDRAAIGIATSSGGMRDTLGLLVQSVTPGGPADKAGIEEGNRLVSINGVNLRLSAADAGEGDMDGIAQRRLLRELEKRKAGDEVELRVWAGGQTKTVKVKTVAVEDLPSRARASRREAEERPAIGLSLSATGSRRDTLGMLVVRVSTDGPAEKAGIVEGDRISAINGVSLRVAGEDAGDPYMSSTRMSRYRRELGKVTVGEDVELRVYSGGQNKNVKLKPVRAADLPRDRNSVWIIGDGAFGSGEVFPVPGMVPMPAMPPRAPRFFEYDGDLLREGVRIRIDPRAEEEIRLQATEAARRARDATRILMERLENLQLDVDRRTEEAESILAPSPARPRAGSRIATTGGGGASSVSSAYVPGGARRPGGLLTYTSGGQNAVAATPAVRASGPSVAAWNGDDATFVLQGLTLARVNDDLVGYLGDGSARGFLVVDAGDRWSGLRSGDVLLAVDGKPVRNGDGARITLDHRDNHTAEVIRDGRRRVVEVAVR